MKFLKKKKSLKNLREENQTVSVTSNFFKMKLDETTKALSEKEAKIENLQMQFKGLKKKQSVTCKEKIKLTKNFFVEEKSKLEKKYWTKIEILEEMLSQEKLKQQEEKNNEIRSQLQQCQSEINKCKSNQDIVTEEIESLKHENKFLATKLKQQKKTSNDVETSLQMEIKKLKENEKSSQMEIRKFKEKQNSWETDFLNLKNALKLQKKVKTKKDEEMQTESDEQNPISPPKKTDKPLKNEILRDNSVQSISSENLNVFEEINSGDVEVPGDIDSKKFQQYANIKMHTNLDDQKANLNFSEEINFGDIKWLQETDSLNFKQYTNDKKMKPKIDDENFQILIEYLKQEFMKAKQQLLMILKDKKENVPKDFQIQQVFFMNEAIFGNLSFAYEIVLIHYGALEYITLQKQIVQSYHNNHDQWWVTTGKHFYTEVLKKEEIKHHLGILNASAMIKEQNTQNIINLLMNNTNFFTFPIYKRENLLSWVGFSIHGPAGILQEIQRTAIPNQSQLQRENLQKFLYFE